MGANKPKRNHYNPMMLLKNFCDDGGLLWVGDKCQREPFRTSPRKVFVEKNLYAKEEFPESTVTYECEEELARIESEAAPAISALIEQARRGCPPRLSPELNGQFKRFAIAQARRTPESQKRIFPDDGADRAFHVAATKLFRKAGYAVPDDDWFDQYPVQELKERVNSNRIADFAAGQHPLVQQQTELFCRETGWGVAVICMPGRSFVIGSHGLTIVEQRGPTYGSWLPIAHDVAIQFTASPDRGFLLRLDRNNESIIKAINRSTAAGSRIVAGRSEALIWSLIRNYWRRVQGPSDSLGVSCVSKAQ